MKREHWTAGLLTLLLLPLSAWAQGALLVVENAHHLEALATGPDGIWFAVGSKAPRQPYTGSPVEFADVRAGQRTAAGTAVVGLWREDGIALLKALPADAAQGSDRAYGINAISAEKEGAVLTGGVNLPKQPVGRFFIARMDTKGNVRVLVHGGPAGVALATHGDATYVDRNADAPDRHPNPELARQQAWSKTLRVDGVPGFGAPVPFSWTPGRGLVASGQGVWGAALFSGRVRADGLTVQSPSMSELPVRVEEGLPPFVAARMRSALAKQPTPPLGAALLVHVDPDGRLQWLKTVAPASVVLDSGGGMSPARVMGLPFVALDSAGNAYLFGRYEQGVQSDGRRLEVPLDDVAPGEHCYLASWDAGGHLRWLRDVPHCGANPIGLGVDGDRLVAVTETTILRFDLEHGDLLASSPLPAPKTGHSVTLHWSQASVAHGVLALGGVFRGEAELLGRQLNEPGVSVVIARLPLEAMSHE